MRIYIEALVRLYFNEINERLQKRVVQGFLVQNALCRSLSSSIATYSGIWWVL